MRLLMLSDIDSMHTVNWANGLSQVGVEVHLCGFYSSPESLQLYNQDVKLYAANRKAGVWSKADFLAIFPWVKKIGDRVQPDIVHAHYASSYGLLARRLNHHHTIVSVWGSDIYAFPNSGNISRTMLSKNLDHARIVCSTSKDMALKTKELTETTVHVVPFGVDVGAFKPMTSNKQGLRIGTVKSLETTYGIDYLLRVFALIHETLPDVTLHIVGEGSQRSALTKLADELGISASTTFYGGIANAEVPEFLSSLEIFFALSRAESFGVSVIEAAACGLPAIVSNVGGLPETVEEGQTGFVMSTEDLPAIAEKAIQMLRNETLRSQLSNNAVKMVEEKYSRKACVNLMLTHYRRLVG